MPDKTDEERERIAKKLAEQRAKIEGMPTTAKVSVVSGIISQVYSWRWYTSHTLLWYVYIVFF